ncbi:hypothetical protein L1987_06621 [Smallanthus sonchifolius]|uniref:Uncharacterized protein n=1 Tax=Smallanthus sonchifolius TaxID=185202 RepID=A0ACB9JYU7_9ASTR|nr:hypothetical protein L1987_06621 [Smallanthus sonchifolius]
MDGVVGMVLDVGSTGRGGCFRACVMAGFGEVDDGFGVFFKAGSLAVAGACGMSDQARILMPDPSKCL